MTEQNTKEQTKATEQLQQLTTPNTVLEVLIKAQQKKIDELLKSSNRMMAALQTQPSISPAKICDCARIAKNLQPTRSMAFTTSTRKKTRGHSGTEKSWKNKQKLKQTFRAKSNEQHRSNTPVDRSKVSITLTHETQLNA